MTEQQVYNIAFVQASYLREQHLSWVNPYETARIMTAISFIESTYNPNAKNSHSTAKGLTQVTNPAKQDTERWLKISNAPYSKMYDPNYNMLIGTRYFLYQFNRYGKDLKKSVIAYNQGSYNTSKDGADYWAKFEKAYNRIAPQYQTASMNPLAIALMVSVAGGLIYYYYKG
jgi:hypothetical protein